jgi:hypothetical protein
MMTRLQKYCLWILPLSFGILGADQLKASIASYRSIPDAVAASDVIAVGQVDKIEPSSDGSSGRILLSSLEILKGVSPTDSVVLIFNSAARGDHR